jgi:hypothetical protein
VEEMFRHKYVMFEDEGTFRLEKCVIHDPRRQLLGAIEGE